MNKSLKKAVAVSAVCAAALAGGVASNATAVAKPSHSAAKAGGITKFGYKANVFGTKVVVNGVELEDLKDALAVAEVHPPAPRRDREGLGARHRQPARSATT